MVTPIFRCRSGANSALLLGGLDVTDEIDQNVAVTTLGRAPAAQAFASQLFERGHQLRLFHNPLAICHQSAHALSIAFICHHEGVAPLARRQAMLGDLTSDVDIEVFLQIVDNSCQRHNDTSCENGANSVTSIVVRVESTDHRQPESRGY